MNVGPESVQQFEKAFVNAARQIFSLHQSDFGVAEPIGYNVDELVRVFGDDAWRQRSPERENGFVVGLPIEACVPVNLFEFQRAWF